MTHIESFDSAEQMFEYLADMNRQGRSMMERFGLTADDLGPGTYWMCMSMPGLVIIGRAEDSPYSEDHGPIHDARCNGYIYGNWYSRVVPEGEWGSNHFSWCLPLSCQQFAAWYAYIEDKEVEMPEGEWPRWKNTTVCPRCGGPVPRAGAVGQYPGALSRRDNYTYICSDCGMEEAMEDFEGRVWDAEPYWQTKEG